MCGGNVFLTGNDALRDLGGKISGALHTRTEKKKKTAAHIVSQIHKPFTAIICLIDSRYKIIHYRKEAAKGALSTLIGIQLWKYNFSLCLEFFLKDTNEYSVWFLISSLSLIVSLFLEE